MVLCNDRPVPPDMVEAAPGGRHPPVLDPGNPVRGLRPALGRPARGRALGEEGSVPFLRADLHNHSCLLPCGSLDLSPAVLARRARERGLDLAALTDHNCARNAPAFRDCAATGGPGRPLRRGGDQRRGGPRPGSLRRGGGSPSTSRSTCGRHMPGPALRSAPPGGPGGGGLGGQYPGPAGAIPGCGPGPGLGRSLPRGGPAGSPGDPGPHRPPCLRGSGPVGLPAGRTVRGRGGPALPSPRRGEGLPGGFRLRRPLTPSTSGAGPCRDRVARGLAFQVTGPLALEAPAGSPAPRAAPGPTGNPEMHDRTR
ncbi:MAG: PHP domain-containing protein [Candidatus Moduliflexus flocculans]|nr:PHP domain-containing protein [Candidatus Moduliflexus flocculans]